jgi:hypothetical protein
MMMPRPAVIDISFNFLAVVIAIALLVGITFVSKIPASYRSFADSFPGRIISISVVSSTYYLAGWPTALLMTVFLLLVLAGGPHQQLVENFTTINIDIADKNKKWYDEKLLGLESVIKTEEVNTSAVQGN